MHYPTAERYHEALRERGVLPDGFRVSTHPVSFFPRERESELPYAMRLSLIVADEPTESFAGVFTRNAVPGAPVVVGRRRLAEPRLRGILVNTRVANVCAEGGEDDIRRILEEVARHLGGSPREYLAASTGIIGWRLPVAEIVAAVPALTTGLGRGSIVEVAEAIMTTDAYPKVRSAPAGNGRVVGIAKGAGMIEPDLATLLCFVLTDCAVERDSLRGMLSRVAERTFNRISVDGDQSTSDMLVALSSGFRGTVDEAALEVALHEVCQGLAEDVVRNGEGVGHVLRVVVEGAPDVLTARGAAKAIVNSPLVKAAVFGNDPNVGRLVSALGDYFGSSTTTLDLRRLRLDLCGETVLVDGVFTLDPQRERRLAASLEAASLPTAGKTHPPHEDCVVVRVNLGSGSAECVVMGADLSYDYVRENADYRS